MKIITLILLLFGHISLSHASTSGVVRSATPVLNTPTIGAVFKEGGVLKRDRCGQVRELEFIALPGTVFTVHQEIRSAGSTVLRVSTDEYRGNAAVSLYIDKRFVEIREEEPPARSRKLPSRLAVIAGLRDAVGLPYVWGGNVSGGVPELEQYYYRTTVPAAERSRLLLDGLDCSGLLYQATDGWTPRNTSHLVSYGRPIAIAGKTAAEIIRQLEPLDLIVWNGHVIIVLDGDTAIESRLECGKKGNGGVVLTPLRKRLNEVMNTRRPVDNWLHGGKQQGAFVVRRWYEY